MMVFHMHKHRMQPCNLIVLFEGIVPIAEGLRDNVGLQLLDLRFVWRFSQLFSDIVIVCAATIVCG